MNSLMLGLFYVLVIEVHLTCGIKARCSACRSVATEMEKKVDVKRGSSLSSKTTNGKLKQIGRRGFGEFQVAQMFEKVCTLEVRGTYVMFEAQQNTAVAKWLPHGREMLQLGWSHEDVIKKSHSTEIMNYCSELLEEHDEEIVEFLADERNLTPGALAELLCQRLSHHCSTDEFTAACPVNSPYAGAATSPDAEDAVRTPTKDPFVSIPAKPKIKLTNSPAKDVGLDGKPKTNKNRKAKKKNKKKKQAKLDVVTDEDVDGEEISPG